MKFLFSLLLTTLALVSAHVTITPASIPAVGSTILNFQLSHGCNSTTLTNKVVIMFPTNITTIKPVDKVGWKLSRTVELLDYKTSAGTPAFYYNFTWEVDPSLYQGLPDWAFDLIQIRVSMTAGQVPNGSKFYVPVWQYCTGGGLNAWISTSSSSSSDTHGAGAEPAPSFSVIDTSDIQFIPSQANVKLLSDKVANLTINVQALTGGSSPTTSAPVVNAGANTINYFEDSSSWRKADTISVIAIILAAISILVSVILTIKIASIEKQNTMLSK